MKLFGTDGVRGIANLPPMTAEIALGIGRATAYLFSERDTKGHLKPIRVVIGKDTRLSGYMVESALVAGFCSMGARVFLVGPLPTPGIAFLTRSMRADVGIVISASHNAYPYNGIKIFDRHGHKLSSETEQKIETLVGSPELDKARPTGESIGKAARIDDAIGRYIVFLKNTFPEECDLNGLRVVLDCANGAAYKVAPIVFSELGAEVFPIHCQPDGKNINEACGAMDPHAMARAVHEHRADVGIALDGDGDRVVLADEKGEIVEGDTILALCAQAMVSSGTLRGKAVVGTVMSNLGLQTALKSLGLGLLRSDVGDRHVVERMQQEGCNLGGEPSGHIVFLDHNTTGDGIIAALKVLAILQKTRKKLSQLREVMRYFPQVQRNVTVSRKESFEKFPQILEIIQEAEASLGSSGKVLVRYSGTEPLARILIEGEDHAVIKEFANRIAQTIQSCLG